MGKKEKIKSYSLFKRIGYAKRNNWFKVKSILGIKIPLAPSNFDIHINNTWKDVTKRKNN